MAAANAFRLWINPRATVFLGAPAPGVPDHCGRQPIPRCRRQSCIADGTRVSSRAENRSVVSAQVRISDSQYFIPRLLEEWLGPDPDNKYQDDCSIKFSTVDVDDSACRIATALVWFEALRDGREETLIEYSPAALLAWRGTIKGVPSPYRQIVRSRVSSFGTDVAMPAPQHSSCIRR